MKISNPKVDVPKGIDLNDKDYMNKLLCCLKEHAKNMTTVLTEASNEKLYKEYKKMYDKIIDLQRETYENMFQNGWYQLETAEANKIKNKLNTLDTEFMDLNNDDEE